MTILSDKFILVDGNSLANRAFYAIPMLSNSQGFITNAIYGFYNMLCRILEDEKPKFMAIAFDKGKIVFRHQDYQEYKAQRKGMPDELRPQFPVLKELLKAMNLAIFEIEGYEADDIIGTLVKWGEKEGLQNIIVTGDRDAFQLISPQTQVVLTRKGITELELYNEEILREKYGLKPSQMIDLKGLMGDASDNIPGIPGVGEKTALKLVLEYGDIENVLAHAGDFQGKKLGQLLLEYADQARLSKKLATIECCVPLEITKEALLVREPDYPRVLQHLQELEFKNSIQAVMEKMASRGNQAEEKEQLLPAGLVINDRASLAPYLSTVKERLCLLLKTTGEGMTGARITGLGLLSPSREPLWLEWENDSELKDMLEEFKTYLEDEHLPKTVHDTKKAILALAPYRIALRGVDYDTLLMAYLLNPSRPETNLSLLAAEYLGRRSVFENEKEEAFFQLQSMEDLGPRLRKELEEQEMWDLYGELELPLSYVLAKMELTGVRLDRKILIEIGEELDKAINKYTSEIYDLAGEEFNINSPKQLGVILFEKLGLTKGKKTKTGYSTSADVLEALAQEHEIVANILHYRQLVKLKSTYIDGLQAIIDPATGKVHTSFNQAVTATGRLSSTEPNLQNIPIRMEEGRRIRKAFIPSRDDYMLLTADYSQIELRVLAHIAQDEVLIEAFLEDQDIHIRTASEVFGVRMEYVTKEMRRAAKAVNFGIVYGISDFGLSQDLGITRAEAKAYIDSYFARYRGVKDYIDRVIAQAREKGYVVTLLNRRRYLPDILSRNFHLRSFAERAAMNTPIQGSAADIIKLAMLKLQEVIEKEQPEARMILQVHDELIFEVPREKIPLMGAIVNEVMSQAYPLAVPLKVDLQTGPNWYDLVPLKV
ncbi:MAG: DNA polymerase I [Bacillota bacterium]|uniref:DNA polymerase I n=1 Tax=Thermanaerosceptrum fracticalcis TaxID=1712410 RepID=UPI0030842FB8